jgi:hypothetical protein
MFERKGDELEIEIIVKEKDLVEVERKVKEVGELNKEWSDVGST